MKKLLFFTVCVGMVVGTTAMGAWREDDASNYSGGWNDVDTYGTGFSTWSFTQSGGFWVPDDTDPTGFNAGIYSDSGGSVLAINYGTGYINATRDISDWGSGYIFNIDLATQWRQGARGIDFQDSSDVSLFTFNVSDGGYGDTGWNYQSDMLLNFSVLQNGADLDISIVGSSVLGSWTDTYTTNITSATLDGFSLYAGDTGGDNQQALLFNNMEVIPEPTSALLLLLGTFSIYAWRKSRR